MNISNMNVTNLNIAKWLRPASLPLAVMTAAAVLFARRFAPRLAPWVALALLLGAGASAQENSTARAHAFASLPNWSGLWETKLSAASDNPSGYPDDYALNPTQATPNYFQVVRAIPPYKPAWAGLYQAEVKRAAPFTESCGAIPFPVVLEAPSMFQVFVTPEETLFLYETGTARHIYTDGRKHPKKEDLWPTDLGNSIGHWEGTTLVIDTIKTKPGGLPGTAFLSADVRFTERVRRVGHDTLQDDLTIDDPERLLHPWHIGPIRWSRVHDQDRLIAYDCANNRNPIVNGKVTIAPP